MHAQIQFHSNNKRERVVMVSASYWQPGALWPARCPPRRVVVRWSVSQNWLLVYGEVWVLICMSIFHFPWHPMSTVCTLCLREPGGIPCVKYCMYTVPERTRGDPLCEILYVHCAWEKEGIPCVKYCMYTVPERTREDPLCEMYVHCAWENQGIPCVL